MSNGIVTLKLARPLVCCGGRLLNPIVARIRVQHAETSDDVNGNLTRMADSQFIPSQEE